MRNLILLAVLSLTVATAISANAQIGALGVMGDSLSDEYFEESYGTYATNWVQQLVVYRGPHIQMGHG